MNSKEHDEKEQPERQSGMAARLAGGAGNMLSAALRPVGEATSEARRMLGERGGARVRRVRRMGHRPLANLWDEQPEARLASIRELGVRVVPVEQICGTAVEGPAQRGGDFLPLRDRRGQDWRARWQRILSAIDNMVVLPPVDLLKVGNCYWVVDGHNRVAAALYTGQVAVDANVTELRLPGQQGVASEGNLAPYLETSRDIRAAGSGRLTRTSVRPLSVRDAHDLAEHGDQSGGHHHGAPLEDAALDSPPGERAGGDETANRRPGTDGE